MMRLLEQSHGLSLAVLAGVMASLGSTSAKLAMSGDVVLAYCLPWFGNSFCEKVCMLIQAVFFLLIFVCNGVMWTFFTKSLQYCSSSVIATVTNTASNFLFSAIMGLFLFSEHLSVRWWFGSVLILVGLILINKGNMKDEAGRKADKEK